MLSCGPAHGGWLYVVLGDKHSLPPAEGGSHPRTWLWGLPGSPVERLGAFLL